MENIDAANTLLGDPSLEFIDLHSVDMKSPQDVVTS